MKYFLFVASLPIILSQPIPKDYAVPITQYSQFYWTMLTLAAVFLGVGILLYIHACLLRIREEDHYLVYETAPLMTTKIPPPPKYEQVI